MTDLQTPVAVTAAAAPKKRRLNTRYVPVLATGLLLVVMYTVGILSYPGFSDSQILLNIFVDNGFLLVVAVGETFVILSGGIDLSVGAVVALSSVVAAVLLRDGWPAIVVLVLVLALGALIGFAQGVIIHFFEIQPFIATLAGLFLARGLCYVLAPESIPITEKTWTSLAQFRWHFGGFFLSGSALVALVVVGIAALALAYTRFGRNVYAVGGGGQSALLMGLPVARTRVGVYLLSGLFSAVGGVLLSFYTLSGYSLNAQGMELDAIAATVIGGTLLTGGTGYVLGTLLGVLVLGMIQTIITFQGTLSSWWTRIIIGALLFAFILLQRVVTRRRR
jgi:ribose/xylose/arabinose/galactoside ABC-type transport system permease subunit